MTDAVRRLRPAADRRHRARGERRHRQDLHDRRARGALRRRGHAARAAAARHVHADGHGRAARAGARAARQRRAGARRALAAPPSDEVDAAAADGTREVARAATASPARSPTSTRRRSPPPTASARRCSSGLGVAGDVERDAAFVEDVSDLIDEVVDDLYVRRFHAPTTRRRSTAPRRGRIARIAVDNPLAPIEPARRRGGQRAGDARAPRRGACATSSTRRKRARRS